MAADAAGRQNKFWDFHDALFQIQLNERAIDGIAGLLELNLEQWNEDRRSVEARTHVERNVESAVQAGVDATPTLFLNGRRISDLRPQSLRILIDRSIKNLKPSRGM